MKSKGLGKNFKVAVIQPIWLINVNICSVFVPVLYLDPVGTDIVILSLIQYTQSLLFPVVSLQKSPRWDTDRKKNLVEALTRSV